MQTNMGRSGTFNITGGSINGVSGAAYVIAQSYAAVTVPADTNEDTLATVTIPANALGANGMVRVTTLWSCTNNANIKTARVKFGGSNFLGVPLTSKASGCFITLIANRGVTNSQVGPQTADFNISGTSANAVMTAAVDTTAAVTLLITGQKATSGDAMTLEGYTVEIVKP